MSMVSELVKELMEYAKGFKNSSYGREIGGIEKLLIQAADTIEELSAKVARQNMERSSQYYGGGWISCSERLPEEHEERNEILVLTFSVIQSCKVSDLVLVTVYDSDQDKTFVTDDCTVDGKWANYSSDCYEVLAWQPLPPAYEQKE